MSINTIMVRLFSVTAVVGYLMLARSSAQRPEETEAVSVEQFGSGKVVGHLEHALGTVVRVTGVCIDGGKTRLRADLGKTLLEIRTVNGSKLKRPFVVPFPHAGDDVPKDGDRFDYYVHEWGTFDGIVDTPKELGIDKLNVANDGFHYRPKITIHKTNKAVAKPAVQRSGTKQ